LTENFTFRRPFDPLIFENTTKSHNQIQRADTPFDPKLRVSEAPLVENFEIFDRGSGDHGSNFGTELSGSSPTHSDACVKKNIFFSHTARSQVIQVIFKVVSMRMEVWGGEVWYELSDHRMPAFTSEHSSTRWGRERMSVINSRCESMHQQRSLRIIIAYDDACTQQLG
jgi:hypothetical protein